MLIIAGIHYMIPVFSLLFILGLVFDTNLTGDVKIDWFDVLHEILFIPIGLILLILGKILLDRYEKVEQQKRNISANENEIPVILYLRPFVSDGNIIVSNPDFNPIGLAKFIDKEKDDLQFLLTNKFNAELVAIGRRIDGFGAGIIQARDVEWFHVFKNRAKKALLIIALPSYHTSTFREINYLVQEEILHKCIFIMPPLNAFSDGSSTRDFWKKTTVEMNKIQINLPDYNPSGGIFIIQNMLPEILIPKLDQEGVKQLREEINNRILQNYD